MQLAKGGFDRYDVPAMASQRKATAVLLSTMPTSLMMLFTVALSMSMSALPPPIVNAEAAAIKLPLSLRRALSSPLSEALSLTPFVEPGAPLLDVRSRAATRVMTASGPTAQVAVAHTVVESSATSQADPAPLATILSAPSAAVPASDNGVSTLESFPVATAITTGSVEAASDQGHDCHEVRKPESEHEMETVPVSVSVLSPSPPLFARTGYTRHVRTYAASLSLTRQPPKQTPSLLIPTPVVHCLHRQLVCEQFLRDTRQQLEQAESWKIEGPTRNGDVLVSMARDASEASLSQYQTSRKIQAALLRQRRQVQEHVRLCYAALASVSISATPLWASPCQSDVFGPHPNLDDTQDNDDDSSSTRSTSTTSTSTTRTTSTSTTSTNENNTTQDRGTAKDDDDEEDQDESCVCPAKPWCKKARRGKPLSQTDTLWLISRTESLEEGAVTLIQWIDLVIDVMTSAKQFGFHRFNTNVDAEGDNNEEEDQEEEDHEAGDRMFQFSPSNQVKLRVADQDQQECYHELDSASGDKFKCNASIKPIDTTISPSLLHPDTVQSRHLSKTERTITVMRWYRARTKLDQLWANDTVWRMDHIVTALASAAFPVVIKTLVVHPEWGALDAASTYAYATEALQMFERCGGV